MPSAADPDGEIGRAVAVLQRGGLVAFPTETVWGIAADAGCAPAVARLRAFKGRETTQPISLLVSGPDALGPLACELDARASALIEAFWPGPLTLILPCRGVGLAAGLVNRDGGLGIRCSPHPVAAALAGAAAEAGLGPLTATSCNAHGALPAQTREQARRVCSGGDVAPIVIESGDDAHGAAPSSVLDLCSRPARLLRAGALPERAILDVLEKFSDSDANAGTAGPA